MEGRFDLPEEAEHPRDERAPAQAGAKSFGLPIRLALSGGGMRAAAFHAGVLRRLAAEDLLERVTHVSTVSGGSLLVAAAMSTNGLAWPNSSAYRDDVFPALRRLLMTVDIFSVQA